MSAMSNNNNNFNIRNNNKYNYPNNYQTNTVK